MLVPIAMARLDAPPTIHPARLRSALGISAERMGRLVDLTPKTIARLEASDRLPASAAAASRLAQVQEIVDLGLLVFTSQGLRRFMITPFPAFGHCTALQLIERGEAARVLEELAAAYEGVPS